MAFFEVELCRKLGYQRVGGAAFNTGIVATQSGQESRNSNWLNPLADYAGNLITPVERVADALQFIEDIRTFHYMVRGTGDSFRFYDPLDCTAVNQAMVLVSGSIWQLQKTYALGGRSYVRTITKPITASVLDYQGVALTNTVSIISGATGPTVDHTTGQITFSSVTGTPHATFKYHIPVRLTSDKFEPEIQPSNDPNTGGRVIKWNSLGLIEVRPPNY